MNFDQWYEKKEQVSDPFSDFTYGEQVWKAAQIDVWEQVFQIVSDNPHMATREFIRKLEAAREQAEVGSPVTARP